MTVLFAIDVETLAWSALSDSMSGDIPPGVTNHGLAAVGRTLYLYGGWDTVSGKTAPTLSAHACCLHLYCL